MALTGPLAGARLLALDTSTFIYLIEKHPTFFAAVEPIFQAVDAGTIQATTSVLTLLEVLVKPLEANPITLADDFRAALSACLNLRVIESTVPWRSWPRASGLLTDTARRMRATSPRHNSRGLMRSSRMMTSCAASRG